MSDNNRRKLLEAYAKQVAQGNPLSEDLVRTQLPEFNPSEPSGSKYRIQSAVNKRALQARDLAEDSLADQILRNTGIPIPDDKASRLKKEDFLKRLIQERYPEFKMDDDIINLSMMNEPSVPEGIYNSDNGKIFIKNRPDTVKNLSTAFHEAAHKYDMENLNFDGTADVNDLQMKKSGLEKGARAINDIDPTEAYEIMAKGHHTEIPKLREGSFGLGALKSYLKSGTFKGIAPVGIGAAITAAALPEDASASDFIPVLDQADNAGSSMDDKMLQTEVKARQNYEKSPAYQDRRGFKLGEQPSVDSIDTEYTNDNQYRKEALKKLIGDK